MDPLVSVIVPTYNSARYIRAAVESVLAQTHQSFELIVVDDGSTDNTRDVLAAHLGRLRYERRDNRGVYAARNRGVSLSRAPYLAFLDADDLWEPSKLAEQVQFMEAHPDFGAVHTDAAIIDREGRTIKASSNARRQSRDGMVFEEFFRVNMAVILMSTVMIRRSCFDALGPFDERDPVVQDYFYFLRLSWQFPVGFLPAPLVRYRVTPGSLSRRSAPENVATRQRLLDEFIAAHADYFHERPDLVRRRWQSFHFDAGTRLFHHQHFALSHRHFLQALGHSPSAWLWWLLTSLPDPALRALAGRRPPPPAAAGS